MGDDAVLAVVPHRADLKVRFVHAQSSFGLGELHIGAPLPPTRHLGPAQLREALGIDLYLHVEQPGGRSRVALQKPSDGTLHSSRFLPTLTAARSDLR